MVTSYSSHSYKIMHPETTKKRLTIKMVSASFLIVNDELLMVNCLLSVRYSYNKTP